MQEQEDANGKQSTIDWVQDSLLEGCLAEVWEKYDRDQLVEVFFATGH
jgi:hypothetical protein